MLVGLSIRIGKSVFNYYLVIEPWQRNLGLAGLLLVGPCFWLYGKAIIQRQTQLNVRDLLCFAPALVYAAFCWLIPNQKDWISGLSYALVMSHWAIYLYLSAKQASTIKRTLALEASTWHRQILIGLGVLWSYYFLVFVQVLPYYLGGAVVYSLLIFGLTILLLDRKHFSSNKYLQTKQSTEQTRSTMKRIEQVMDSDALYLDPELTVAKMANLLNLSTRQVSRAINEVRGQGFSAFVKHYRLEHAKRLLADRKYQKAKMVTVASDSGFGNVASFNSAFTTLENTTPSEYRDRVTKESNNKTRSEITNL